MANSDTGTASRRHNFTGAICALAACLAAAPAQAIDVCPDLWLSRNAIFNDAGYCFGSPLGKALFDNADCSTRTPALTREQERKVALIRDYEKSFDCRVDTKRTDLAVDQLAIRLRLLDHPVADGYEATCIGVITNAPVALHAGKTPASDIIGFIRNGDTIDFAHEPEGEWGFATRISRHGQVHPILGWYRTPITPETCRDFAG